MKYEKGDFNQGGKISLVSILNGRKWLEISE